MLTINTNPSSAHPKECKVISHCGFDLYFPEERKFYLFLSDFDGLFFVLFCFPNCSGENIEYDVGQSGERGMSSPCS